MADAAVAHFTEITGSGPETATQYLQLADYNLETAMQLFYENGGAEIQAEAPAVPSASSRPRPSTSSRPYEDEDGVVHLDSDAEGSDTSAPIPVRTAPQQQPHGPSFEDDLAMARRLQEELYAGGDSHATRSDDVRAPIARTTETLVGPGADYGYDDDEEQGPMNSAILQQLRARQQARNSRAGIFNQQNIWTEDTPSSHRDLLARATGGASETSTKSSTLAEMYRPPFELMSRLPWDVAREEGRKNEKWLLVNIQDPSVFDCQLLNRDLWKNPGIAETVKEHFIFLQFSKDDPRGTQYLQYYFAGHDVQDNYPHIAIVDPRTGEQMKTWSGPPVPSAPDFLIQLHEFLDRYSLNHKARNPVAKRKPEVRAERKIETMTEEEMLEMALKNSLEGEPQARSVDPDDLTRSVEDVKGKGKGKARETGDEDVEMEHPAANGHEEAEEEDESTTRSNIFASIPSDRSHVEPDPDPATVTRIQFRHPSGRVIRRFALADPVRRIYEWLKASPLEGKAGVEFELVSLGQNLINSLETTIQDAGLKNGTVMVGFVEED
ncbi:hypothetical protein AJ80_00397 [Polytolypa hystricis UAMH7299]|uniref:UBX domain-containing protein n=1 Tax=Polytolypa hystricis (strain UAMH7299) TaxID=1447883 RepID=A0A2B7Z4S8_POLH7|nr:hypothetical protein AJ80_00397 [Polytolypa hystricis UAMH7299]